MAQNDRAARGGGRSSSFDLTPVPQEQQGIGQDAYRVQYADQVGYSPGIVQNNGADWFGPLNPMRPVAPQEVIGRRTDFPSGFNLELTPRPYEPVKFPEMRALADTYDVLRIVIETRKDQMERLTWGIHPKLLADGSAATGEDDPAIQEITDFLQLPDGKHDWNTWLRALLEDMFVIDACSIYCHETRGGKLLALEQIDGAGVKRVIDDWGRTPDPPAPAYQQILKGFPAVNYTEDQLLYVPRNIRVHKFYGYSPVEQIIMTVNIALRRQVFQLQYYTEGNVPEALVGTPGTWTPKQIQDFQTAFDAMLAGNQAYRRRIKFIPGDVAKTYVAMKEPELTGKMDEWLARIVCFCFSISPQAFVSMMNRATADSAHDAAIEEGLAPVQNWVKRVINRVIRKYWPNSKVEFTWDDDSVIDPKEQMEVLTGYVKYGIKKANEARELLGDPPDPAGDKLRVIGANGAQLLEINDDAPTAGETFDQKNKAASDALEASTKVKVAQAKSPQPQPSSGQQTAQPAKPADGGAAAKAAGTFRKGYWASGAHPHDPPHEGGGRRRA